MRSAPGTNARIAFDSTRTTGTGVNNPTGDYEIFTIRPDGTGLKQLTFNEVEDYSPVFSPDGSKIAYVGDSSRPSNPEGDWEVYVMNASDGSGEKNLSNNGTGVYEDVPVFSPDGQWVAYHSVGAQPSNPEGDAEVYRVKASDGSDQKNLTNNGADVDDRDPSYSPGGAKVAYHSGGKQTSNSQGDWEVYRMNSTDGSGKKNLSNNGSGVDESSADWGRQAM